MTDMKSSKALRIALAILEQWENSTTALDDLLDIHFAKHADDPRKAVSSLLFAFFRNKALIDALIAAYSVKKVKKSLRLTLEIALAMALFQNFPGVEQSVDLAVSYVKKRFNPRVGAFANAVLRKCCDTDLDVFRSRLSASDQANMPSELFTHLRRQLSNDDFAETLKYLWVQNPFCFRICKGFELDKQLSDSIGAKKINHIPWGDVADFYQCDKPKELIDSDLFAAGGAYIQDLSTSLFLAVLDDIPPGARVADLCSAPGGKALMLAERMPGGNLLLADRSKKRQRYTIENFAKRKFPAKVRIVCSSVQELQVEKKSLDIVLLDVPCSNTGVYRHRPDAAWNFSLKKLSELLEMQKSILHFAAGLLKNNGVLLYSSCSITEEENTRQIQNFVRNNEYFELETEKLLLPHRTHDGAYVAKLRKKYYK